MHYADPEQLNDNSLKLVIYTHGGDPKGTLFDITSIHECRHFSPRLLDKITKVKQPKGRASWYHVWFDKPEFNSLSLEKYFLVELKQTGWDDIEIVSVTDVSLDSNHFYQLH